MSQFDNRLGSAFVSRYQNIWLSYIILIASDVDVGIKTKTMEKSTMQKWNNGTFSVIILWEWLKSWFHKKLETINDLKALWMKEHNLHLTSIPRINIHQGKNMHREELCLKLLFSYHLFCLKLYSFDFLLLICQHFAKMMLGIKRAFVNLELKI